MLNRKKFAVQVGCVYGMIAVYQITSKQSAKLRDLPLDSLLFPLPHFDQHLQWRHETISPRSPPAVVLAVFEPFPISTDARLILSATPMVLKSITRVVRRGHFSALIFSFFSFSRAFAYMNFFSVPFHKENASDCGFNLFFFTFYN